MNGAPDTPADIVARVVDLATTKMLTAIVVFAEVVDEDGDPAIIVLRDESDSPWRQLGLVQTGLAYCEKRVHAALFGGDE